MPIIKEIKYFYETQWYPNESIWQRFAKGDFHNDYYREHLGILLRNRKNVRTYLKYFIGKRNLNWYLSLFPKTKVSGDISPQYFNLPQGKIKEIKSVLPEVKIIINIRNPIDWSWSMARMSNNFQNLDFRKQYPTAENIQKWRDVFPPEQILIADFEKLKTEPETYFFEICDFIGISRKYTPVKNSDRSVPMPNEVRQYLTELWK